MSRTSLASFGALLLLAVPTSPSADVLTVTASAFVPSAAPSVGSFSIQSTVGQSPAAATATAGSVALVHGFWLWELEPTASLELASFTATVATSPGLPELRWTSQTEVALTGFRVFRAESLAGGWSLGEEVTSALVAATGDGSSYTATDPTSYTDGDPTRTYLLQAVTTGGISLLAGPVTLTVDSQNGGSWLIY